MQEIIETGRERGADLFDLPLLRVRDFGEPLALQGVVLLQLGGVAKVQVTGSVGVPHGDVVAAFWAHISSPVGVKVLSCVLVHILAEKHMKKKKN